MTQPTQIRHPGRATLRTIAAALIGALPLVPIVAHESGLDKAAWLAVPIAVAAGVTRVLALPAVDDWMRRYVPWLATRP